MIAWAKAFITKAIKSKIVLLVFLFSAIIHLSITIFFYSPTQKYWDVELVSNACIVSYDKDMFYTCEDLEYTVDYKSIDVPSGFTTDLLSIPRVFWLPYSVYDYRYIASAILHDYLYSCHSGYTRDEIDEIFYYSLIQEGNSRPASFMFWLFVRFFGANYFMQEENCYGSQIGYQEPEETEGDEQIESLKKPQVIFDQKESKETV